MPASRDLHSVAHEVVGTGERPSWVRLEVLVSGLGRREGVVRGVPSPLVFVPIEEREVHDEGEGQLVRVCQLEAAGHLSPERVEGDVGRLCGTGDDEEQVAGVRPGLAGNLLHHVQ